MISSRKTHDPVNGSNNRVRILPVVAQLLKATHTGRKVTKERVAEMAGIRPALS